MVQLVQNLRNNTDTVLMGGGEKARNKHVSKGKLLVRDRINLLLDKNSAFLELSSLSSYEMYDKTIHCSGIITGIGKIHG